MKIVIIFLQVFIGLGCLKKNDNELKIGTTVKMLSWFSTLKISHAIVH